MSKSASRVYRLVLTGKAHLVKAISREQAISHVTRPLVSEIDVASGVVVAEMMASGVPLEDATIAPAIDDGQANLPGTDGEE